MSTLSVLYGLGEEAEDVDSLREKLALAKNQDGSPVFTSATCLSLLVFFVLAMQCLPTQAVTRRETGSWGWAAFQVRLHECLGVRCRLDHVSDRECGLGVVDDVWG